MTTDAPFRLYERPGWGSAIIEAQLAAYGMPVVLQPVGHLLNDPAALAELEAVNPMRQVPVLVLPSGAVMTESAAMTLHLADLAQSGVLVPGPDAPERAAFLRWLVHLVAQVYPTFAFGDVPARFVTADAADAYLGRVMEYRQAAWLAMEAAAAGPWFLGARYSALDVYLAVMTRWRPGPAWFQDQTPRLWACAESAAARPEMGPVMARNFG